MKTFRKTNTGICIPTRKIKRMPPLPSDCSAELPLPMNRCDHSAVNYNLNLIFLPAGSPNDSTLVDDSDIIEIENYEEGSNDDC